jgi:hypothetical protein
MVWWGMMPWVDGIIWVIFPLTIPNTTHLLDPMKRRKEIGMSRSLRMKIGSIIIDQSGIPKDGKEEKIIVGAMLVIIQVAIRIRLRSGGLILSEIESFACSWKYGGGLG